VPTLSEAGIDVQARIKDLGLLADPSSGAAFRERIAQDIPKYTAVAKAAGSSLIERHPCFAARFGGVSGGNETQG
jgi:hypothetical protein